MSPRHDGKSHPAYDPDWRTSGKTVIGLIQRVSRAKVLVGSRVVGRIDSGLLAFIGVERGDGEKEADRLAERMVSYRVFSDDQGRMNLALRDVGGGILLVPQFTLAANTRKGSRASFGPAADPGPGEKLFDRVVESVRQSGVPVATGEFGAHMKVALENDGPVTFLLVARPKTSGPRQRGTV
jgi:D-tyrosyl-tRNA(Tyr) deacylase